MIKCFSRKAARSVFTALVVGRNHADTSQNRMMESLLLFDSVVNSRWFMRTSIILFLNKVDIFKAKLPRSPLGNYFPDYSGGNDVNKAAKYLLWRFNQVNRAHLNLYPQYVTIVFQDVQNLIPRLAALRKRPIRPTFGWYLQRSKKRYSTMHLRIPAFCEVGSLRQLGFP